MVRASARNAASSCLTRLTFRRTGLAGSRALRQELQPSLPHGPCRDRVLSAPAPAHGALAAESPTTGSSSGQGHHQTSSPEILSSGQISMERAGWVFHRSAEATTTRHPLLTGRRRAWLC